MINEGLKFGCKGKGEQGKIRNSIAQIPKNVHSSSELSIFAHSDHFMQLIPITTSSQAKEFIQANVQLNRQHPAYIRPIDAEIDEVFDPVKNKAFRHGEVTR